MNRLLGIAFAAIAIMVAIAGLIGRADPAADSAPLAQASTATDAETNSSDTESVTMALKRDSSGQFRINGDVNGTSTRFLIDTGADLVALTESSAEAAGILVDAAAFQPIMQTASGQGYAAPVTIETLRLGETELRNVDAVVVQGLGTDLLGQNVLRKMGQVTLRGDRMVIQPR